MSVPMPVYEVHCNKTVLQWATFLSAQRFWSMSSTTTTANLD